MRPKVYIAILVAVLLAWGALPAPAETILLPPVTVTSGLPPGCAAARPVAVLERDEIERLPARSVPEALRFVPGVSLASRGLSPVQGDLSLWGSTFSQVLVLLDGVRIADPQTAHHNLDLPVNLEDVERIEVLRGPACARYGADAVAGAINIITRRPGPRYARLEGAGGSFATTRAGASVGGGGERVAGAVSFLREASNGYRFDTDYDVRTLSGKLVAPASGGEPSFDAFVGLQDKSFGAFDFYSPGRGFASREETGTRLATAALHTGGEGRLYEARAFYREHKDEFTLDFRRPALFEANHLTRVAGAQLFGQWEGRGLLSAGLEARGESIESTTLADHRRGVASPFAEYAASVSKLDVDGALRVDYFSGFGAQASPALNLLWHLTPKSLSARAQVATAYRVPSFTELFYRDPANIGNAALKPEKSLNYGAGLVYSGAPLEASLDYFERRESEIIDWVRASTAEPWRAVNSGRVNVRGLEAQLGYLLPWGSARLDYVYVNKGLRTEAVLSKYVLDHPNHQLSLGLWRTPPREAPLWDLALFAGLTWRDYANQDYTLADISLSKRLGRFEPYLEGHNLLNASYSEALVPSPGIWGLGGVRIYFD